MNTHRNATVTDGPGRYPKPWMEPRQGETEAQRIDRVAHSCYRCGHFEVDLGILADHEDGCGSVEASPPPKAIKP
ncbi:hypothetical protein ACFYOT_26345 [Saccharothrix saharensis]|uniref:hypothetical protein n=1 Tax=Saccharothrix saharensis TaxID=571190 RepID=UPI0036CAD13B